MQKENDLVTSITQILTDFALTKFPVKALEVKGPVQEDAKYRWRIVSTRYKEVTVILTMKARLFRSRTLQAIQVFGTSQDRELRPTLGDLRSYLETAELVNR